MGLRQLDTPEAVRAFMEESTENAVLLVGQDLSSMQKNNLLALCVLPMARVHCKVAQKVFGDLPVPNKHDAVTAVYLQHGQRVGMTTLTPSMPLVFTLARHFHDAQYVPVVLQPTETCQGVGHIHVHVATCIVIPRFAKAGACDHMRVLHKLLQYPLVMSRVCLHVDEHTAVPWLANDLGHRLVGVHDILSFLDSMRVVQ